MKRFVALVALALLVAGCATSGPKLASAPPETPNVPAEKDGLVKGEDPGTTIQVSYVPGKLPEVLPTFTDEKTGPLLFSDAPEYVNGFGTMLYSPVEPGDFRFYMYHASENVADTYLHVVLTNKGSKKATIKVTNHALSGPSSRYGLVGFNAQVQFYAGQQGYQFTIEPGKRATLDPRLLKIPVHNTELLMGIWDVTTDQPLDVHEMAAPSGELPDPTTSKMLDRKNHSGAGVGTFPTYRRKAVVKLDGSGQHYTLASGKKGDAWLTGPDHLRGGTGELQGNYGVDYVVTMEFNSPVDRTVRVWMSTVMKLGGAIRIDGKMVRIPEDAFGNIDYPYDSSLITKLDLKAGKTTTFTYEFMPPGAFYLPAIVHVQPETK